MYQNCCKKCGSISLHIENKGSHTGLYCNDCGTWIKWLGKDELKTFNYAKKYFNIVNSLKDFIGFLDNSIDAEMCKLSLSDMDAIRKSSYCLALERCKNSISNILKGQPFDFVE